MLLYLILIIPTLLFIPSYLVYPIVPETQTYNAIYNYIFYILFVLITFSFFKKYKKDNLNNTYIINDNKKNILLIISLIGTILNLIDKGILREYFSLAHDICEYRDFWVKGFNKVTDTPLKYISPIGHLLSYTSLPVLISSYHKKEKALYFIFSSILTVIYSYTLFSRSIYIMITISSLIVAITYFKRNTNIKKIVLSLILIPIFIIFSFAHKSYSCYYLRSNNIENISYETNKNFKTHNMIYISKENLSYLNRNEFLIKIKLYTHNNILKKFPPVIAGATETFFTYLFNAIVNEELILNNKRRDYFNILSYIKGEQINERVWNKGLLNLNSIAYLTFGKYSFFLILLLSLILILINCIELKSKLILIPFLLINTTLIMCFFLLPIAIPLKLTAYPFVMLSIILYGILAEKKSNDLHH